MTFSTFKVVTAPSTIGTGLSASLKMLRGSQTAKLSLALSVPVATEFSWEDGAVLEVQLGEDVHHGLIRLRKNASVGTATVSRRNGTGKLQYFAVPLGHVPALINRSEKKRWCRFERVADGWIEITLPSWADETAPDSAPLRNRAPVAPPLRALPAPMGGGTTARLMGDPPAGRSALAERTPARLKK